ncbi:hypothetical protein [Amycolatopsis dendrobii]|uniref:Uncharacterized protein n=1 Tax=Amycolatopsis dendrobii TaxID=2760662 RepID=A0A7W3ZC94_9PSEU|nr:hypothetical protein [Amycolatopsis dendrobii]MBB1155697.1 hypothetical protein [Amycolatopsis dendrobii]
MTDGTASLRKTPDQLVGGRTGTSAKSTVDTAGLLETTLIRPAGERTGAAADTVTRQQTMPGQLAEVGRSMASAVSAIGTAGR